MAKRELPKYTVYADAPGMQISGIGRGGVIAQGSVITVADPNFEPRATMFPENDAARAQFEAKRKKVEKTWRDKIAAGINPANDEPFVEPPSAKDVERMVKQAVLKVGPNPRRIVAPVKDKKLPRLAPGAIQTHAPAQAKKAVEDDGDEPQMPPPEQRSASGRAADAE